MSEPADFDPNVTVSAPLTDPTYQRLRLAGPVVALRNRVTGQEIELPPQRPRMVLGKRPACDIVVDDRCVSSTHCVFERRPGATPGLLLRDRASRNGTF